MAYYIKTEKENDKLLVIWKQDKDTIDNQYPNTPSEYKTIVVENYPSPLDNGKLFRPYYDINTNTIYYEYVDAPNNGDLQAQIDNLTLALADLMGGALL